MIENWLTCICGKLLLTYLLFDILLLPLLLGSDENGKFHLVVGLVASVPVVIFFVGFLIGIEWELFMYIWR